MKQIDIRFNTDYPESSPYQWRVLINGEETLVNDVRCEVATFSSSTYVQGRGMKWHISAVATDVVFSENLDRKRARIV
jgi:hypothetical protein